MNGIYFDREEIYFNGDKLIYFKDKDGISLGGTNIKYFDDWSWEIMHKNANGCSSEEEVTLDICTSTNPNRKEIKLKYDEIKKET